MFFLLCRQKTRGISFLVAASESGEANETKKNSAAFSSLNYFLLCRQKKVTKKNSPAYKLTAQNLLEPASPDKLLAALVEQYLRSRLSYGFLLRRYL